MTPVEIVLIVTGAIAAVGAVVSAVATILDLRATRKSVKLAEDQARTRPSIEISLELLDVREVDDVWELVKYVLEARQRKVEKERKEREEKEKQKREAQKRQERERKNREEKEAREQRIKEGKGTEFDYVMKNVDGLGPLPLSVDTSKLFNPRIEPKVFLPNRHDSELYDGFLPHRVIRVGVGNRGRVAAYDVTGWLYFNADHLEPLGYFSDGDVAEEPEDGLFKVEVGFREGTKILPTPNDDREFSIAVTIWSPGITKVRYQFQTPQGDTVEGEQELELIRPAELSGQ